MLENKCCSSALKTKIRMMTTPKTRVENYTQRIKTKHFQTSLLFYLEASSEIKSLSQQVECQDPVSIITY